MAKQKIIWTALPNGVHDGWLHLSAFVSPRLIPEGDEHTLAAFPDWADWPGQDIAFTVSVNGGPGVEAEPVPRGSGDPAPSSQLWQQLFTDDTPVAGDTAAAARARLLADGEPLKVRSFPASGLRYFLRDEYAFLGTRFPTSHPTSRNYYLEEPGGVLTRDGEDERGGGYRPRSRLVAFRMSPERKQAAAAAIREEIRTHGSFLGGPLFVFPGGGTLRGDEARAAAGEVGFFFTASEVNVLLAEQFHHRQRLDNHYDTSEPPGVRALQADVEDIDFHLVLGALDEYPGLLRVLGLVRDLRIPVPGELPPAPATVRLHTDWAGGVPTTPVFPSTQSEITADTFVAHATTTVLSGGLLRLDTEDFELVDIDADAGAMKLQAFAETIHDAPGDGGEPPAAMSNTGISLAHVTRSEYLHGLVEKALGMEQQLENDEIDDLDVTAEDINRGFRLDIWDDAGEEWRSLCLRKGTYTFAGGTTVRLDDEGAVVPGHTEQAGDDTVYLHESLARWTGYSLVASRPGQGIGDDGTTTVSTDSEPGEAFDLKATFVPQPGTLPKLRYGRTYRMRARTVDLAGNGLALDDLPADSTDGATGELTYTRFEPVAQPFVVPRKPRTEGESVERLVIRSNYDEAAGDDSQRHLSPGRINQLTAEQHGMFDVPAGLLNPSGMSRLAYAVIAAREPGSYADGGTPDPDGFGTPYYDVDQLRVPFLPDALARGAALAGLPGAADGQIVTVPFDFALLHAWPDARPFRLRLVEGDGAPDWHAGRRVLTVQLPKGRVADVRYSCAITDADRDLLGPWKWIQDFLADGGTLPPGLTVEELEGLARQGQLWQLTPFRTLTLVHAVRQPLAAPTFLKPGAQRAIGETFATIVDKITLDHLSTSKVDVVATWTEGLDVLSKPEPTTLDGHALAFELPIANGDVDEDTVEVQHVHEFHDTKHRTVSYEAVATTRFAEYFVQREQVALDGEQTVAVSAAGIVPASDVVRSVPADPAEARRNYVRGLHYTVDATAGTVTRVPHDDGIPDGATVEVAFVAPPITRSSTEAQPKAVVEVPSSARPAPPDIAYLVPTFGWESSADAASVRSSRLGNGLRVYLRRPWLSSGDGEQLGVVLLEDADAPAAELEHYVTAWAQDPAFASVAPASPPLLDHFPDAVDPASGLRLAESDLDTTLDATVAVAPFDVGYDAGRGLWYSDVTVAPTDTYQPFVRLALARYQPISVVGVELSTVVLAQFAQLAPDRALTVVFGANPAAVTVTVSGLSHRLVDGFAKPPAVTVAVQTADPALSGDLAWTTVTEETTLTGSTPPGTWTGTVPLPAARGSRPMRLVVQEYEIPSMGERRRLVYADTVTL